ncbi:hypothetical protein OC846_002090 [Tilletia horrida]|uniref:Glycosyl hydrolase family 30 TIM-barrel domain-containing protein n=1 Tax=Tilletia horrida TaxID=155126 RepID=A0AAN6JZA1_9BASI|nr:hypothetical protein OC846_002090 [Tilletia horrida]KAK0568112.1 hypothetical protein OC861_002277 [Tilletia horrida]
MYNRYRESVVNDDSSWHKGQTWKKRRRVKAAIILAVVLVVLAIGLGVGLGVGLRKSSGGNQVHTQPVTFPTDSLDLSPNALKTRGYFFTTSNDSDSQTLSWTAGGYIFKNYNANTSAADIIVNTSLPLQQIDGFGGALTDSAAYTLLELKHGNESIYNRTLQALFNDRLGISVLRVPLGGCDFSLSEYSFAPNAPAGDILALALSTGNATNALKSSNFSIAQAENYIIPVLRDILTLQPRLKIMFSPWSAPAWMKNTSSLAGGSLVNGFVPLAAQYYLQSIKAYVDAGIPAWSMTLQNEPNFATKYPSMIVDSATQSQMAATIRGLLPRYNLSDLKIFAHDNNFALWQDAADIVNLNISAIDGIAWHAYKGDPSMINNFRNNVSASAASLETHMTEFTGTDNGSTSRWSSIQYWLQSIYFPMLSQFARSIEVWNIALDPNYGPHLPSAYCSNCVGALQVSTPQHFADPWVQIQPQYINIGHFSAAAADLTSTGGGPAYRVLTIQQPNAPGSVANLSCITSQGFAAPLNGTKLGSSNAATTNTVFSRRVGLVLYNSCDSAQNLTLGIDGRQTSFQVQPGLYTLNWQAP